MSATKWTPGPWIFDDESGEIQGPANAVIGDLDFSSSINNDDIRDANARLVAAAPELYSALLDIQAAHSGQPKSCGCDYECIHTGDNARAALAKARGGA